MGGARVGDGILAHRPGGQIGQVIQVLGDFGIPGVKGQRLSQPGASHFRLAEEPGLVRVLYELGDAVLLCDLRVHRILRVAWVGLGGLGKCPGGCLYVAFLRGAHALGVVLLRVAPLAEPRFGR
jgi:hypothetical protein